MRQPRGSHHIILQYRTLARHRRRTWALFVRYRTMMSHPAARLKRRNCDGLRIRATWPHGKTRTGRAQENRSGHQSTKYFTRTDNICSVAHVQGPSRVLVELISDENPDAASGEMPHQGLNAIDRPRL